MWCYQQIFFSEPSFKTVVRGLFWGGGVRTNLGRSMADGHRSSDSRRLASQTLLGGSRANCFRAARELKKTRPNKRVIKKKVIVDV